MIFYRSCGFYINGFRSSGSWGTSEYPSFGETWHTCSSDYNITSQCTNTTFLDSNGDAQGITVFVVTDCYTNEPLGAGQDPRYAPLFSQYIRANYEHNPNSTTILLNSKNLISYESCRRACLCGYASTKNDFVPIFDGCDCTTITPLAFYYLNNATGLLSLTLSNVSLLFDNYSSSRISREFPDYTDYSSTISTDFITAAEIANGTLADGSLFNVDIFDGFTNLSSSYLSQVIPEGSNLTIKKDFECFGNPDTIKEAIQEYYESTMFS